MNRSTSLLAETAICLVCLFGAFSTTPALAQRGGAPPQGQLVQNVDERGRNPYQETQITTCGGTQHCNFTFLAVPAGKRLVLTHVSGFVDVVGGTFPNSYVASSFGGSQYASVFFPGTKGTVSPTSTRIVYNTDVLAYFDATDQPSGFYGLFSTADTFAGGGELTLSGYYINLP
jgi:hypothetical protein